MELEPVLSAALGMGGGAVSFVGYKFLSFLSAPLDGRTDARRELAKTTEGRRLIAVGERAAAKAGERPIQVTERTAVKVVAEAIYTDDPMVHEYLAGIVAGASADEEGADLVSLIGLLSPRQLRLHFVLYRAFEEIERGAGDLVNLRDSAHLLLNRRVYLPTSPLCHALGMEEGPDTVGRVLRDLGRLAREDLIASTLPGMGVDIITYRMGSVRELDVGDSADAPGAGLTFRPTPAGISFFLAGCGHNDLDPSEIRGFDPALVELFEEHGLAPVSPLAGARLLPRREN